MLAIHNHAVRSSVFMKNEKPARLKSRVAVEKTRRADSADVYGGRLRHGVFNLVPPGGDLTFCVELR